MDMARFGKIMHIDWPIEASMNPTLEEVKEFYKDKSELIKINKIYTDGRRESEYYPDVKIWKEDDDER